MKKFALALCMLGLASAANAASVVWTCTLNTQSLLGPGGGYLATGECASDTGTCDTSQTAFTGAQLCGSSTRVIKDVIISGGENISSVEVEGVLLRHPAVQEVAVVGMPHEKWGEAPHAFVVLREAASATEADLKQFAREHMAHFKMPQRITFVSELPKTATGKIQKYVLRRHRSAISKQ